MSIDVELNLNTTQPYVNDRSNVSVIPIPVSYIHSVLLYLEYQSTKRKLLRSTSVYHNIIFADFLDYSSSQQPKTCAHLQTNCKCIYMNIYERERERERERESWMYMYYTLY
jgi:hypothetical protein